jgi:hypothetical protein
VGFTHTVARNMIALWLANRDTPDGQRIAAVLPPPDAPDDADTRLVQPTHPLHGLL